MGDDTGSPDRDTVSVVIPTLRRWASLERTIAAVLVDPRTDEVVVVVDSEDDEESLRALAQWSQHDPRVRAVSQANAGSNAARERGVREVKGSIIVMLDDDVEAGSGLITGHALRHEGVSKLVVVGYMPVATPVEPTLRVTADVYANGYEDACRMYDEQPGRILERLWSGNVSMRREDILVVGLASPLNLRYHVDLEFGIRCARAGYSAVFDRSLVATHHYERRVDQAVRDVRNGGRALALIAQTLQPRDPRTIHPLGRLTGARRMAVYIVSFRPIRSGSVIALRQSSELMAHRRWFTASRAILRFLLVVESFVAYQSARGPGLAHRQWGKESDNWVRRRFSSLHQ